MYLLLWIYRTLLQYTMEVTAGKSSLEFCVQGFWVSSCGWSQLEEKPIRSLSGDQFGCVSVPFPSVRQWRCLSSPSTETMMYRFCTQITLNKKNITYHHLTVKEKHYCVYRLLWSISMKSLLHQLPHLWYLHYKPLQCVLRFGWIYTQVHEQHILCPSL